MSEGWTGVGRSMVAPEHSGKEGFIRRPVMIKDGDRGYVSIHFHGAE